jgi:hypothetical protein
MKEVYCLIKESEQTFIVDDWNWPKLGLQEGLHISIQVNIRTASRIAPNQ